MPASVDDFLYHTHHDIFEPLGWDKTDYKEARRRLAVFRAAVDAYKDEFDLDRYPHYLELAETALDSPEAEDVPAHIEPATSVEPVPAVA